MNVPVAGGLVFLGPWKKIVMDKNTSTEQGQERSETKLPRPDPQEKPGKLSESDEGTDQPTEEDIELEKKLHEAQTERD